MNVSEIPGHPANHERCKIKGPEEKMREKLMVVISSQIVHNTTVRYARKVYQILFRAYPRTLAVLTLLSYLFVLRFFIDKNPSLKAPWPVPAVTYHSPRIVNVI